MTTYLQYFRDLTKGIKFLQGPVGERLLAAFILPFDGIADQARGGYLSALPGHPEQHESSADQCGKERRLIKFGNETQEEWKEYVADVWDTYGHFTTSQGVLAAVERWGEAEYPGTWPAGVTTVTEPSFARLIVTLPGTLPAFDVPHTYGDGLVYGDDGIYGSSGSARTFALLRSAIRQAKPARSKAKIVLPFSVLPWSGTLLASSLSYPGKVTVSGESTLGRRVEIEIATTGVQGVATFDWTLYDGSNVVLDTGTDTTSAVPVPLGATGIELTFTFATYTAGQTWRSVSGFNVVTQLSITV